MTYSYPCPQCATENDFDFTPSRPAPFCQNHDSAAFSDPGEGAECDGPEQCENCNHVFDIEKVLEAGDEYFSNNRYDNDE